mmetsp:Transcript_30879/g.61568  ORF Transcript_30879/g.61568 Transcript_30879/m.61568 type:complete len:95 (-) Transcript_30879:2471-2755(-)
MILAALQIVRNLCVWDRFLENTQGAFPLMGGIARWKVLRFQSKEQTVVKTKIEKYDLVLLKQYGPSSQQPGQRWTEVCVYAERKALQSGQVSMK